MTKDDGSHWIVTFMGKSGVKWEPDTDAAESSSRDYAGDPWEPQANQEVVDSYSYGYDAPPPGSDTAAERELSPLEKAAADIVSQLIIHAIETSRPHVKHWMQEKAVPFIKESWGKLTTKARRRVVIAQDAANPLVTTELVDAPHGHRYRMTSAEAQQHQRDLEILAQLTAIKVRMLTNAEISDVPDQEPAAALERQHAAEREIVRELANQIEASLDSEAPMIGSGSADQTAWVIRMLGYEVQELPEPGPGSR